MLTRGFFDALVLWPTVVWPLIFSSAFYAFLRVCQQQERRYGFSPLTAGQRASVVTLWVFVQFGLVFDAAVHSYLLWTIGIEYIAMAVPIYILGWMLLPALLDDFAPAPLMLPLIHLCFAAAFLVLLGLFDIRPLRLLNIELYSLMIGVRVAF